MARDEKYTILVADDSFTNRALLTKIFSGEFYVEQAENGARALEILRRRPDMAAVVLDIQMPVLDGFGVLEAMRADESLRNIPVVVATANDEEESQLKALDRGALDVLIKPLNPQVALHRVRNIVLRREADRAAARSVMLEQLLRQSEIDEKTGIYNKQAFCRKASEMIRAHPEEKYLILRWDIDRFKVFNDIFGVAAGDEYLAKVGEAYRAAGEKALYGHWEADHFVACMKAEDYDCAGVEDKLAKFISGLHTDFEFVSRIGVYAVDDPELDVSLMCDRALLALKSIKDDYSRRTAFYNESMRASLIEEQEIVGEMDRALEKRQFVVYLQPQYNYASKTLHGAEALVRWLHPMKGLIAPGKFIPVFERNGFVSKVDEYVWEEVCRLQRGWLDAGLPVVPISVNVSRRDIYNPHLCETISGLVRKYRLPHSLLRLEITESSYMENPEQLIKTVEKLRSEGFAVEMDDFGSGYSSLNTLREVPVDMLKLDMKFLESGMEDSRGGSILTSVIRMAHWIKLPVIAEGVETKAQADYLGSVGCIYMQGYFYAKPMPAEAFESILREEETAPVPAKERNFDDVQGAENFLSSSTQATLLFNSFVGGAAIVEYDGENVEALRLNEKYFEVIGTTREEYQGKQLRLQDRFEPESRRRFMSAIRKAIETGEESNCELCSLPLSKNGARYWTRTRMRLLARNISRYILYCSVENITENMTLLSRNTRLKEQLSAIIDSVPGGIFDYQAHGHEIRTVYFNDTAAAMFGYGREEYQRLFAEEPLSVIHPDDYGKVIAKAYRLLDGRLPTLEAAFRHICADGSWRWVRLTARIVNENHNVIYASGILMDIDAQVKSEQVAARQASELENQRTALQTLYDTIPCGIMQFKAGDITKGSLGLISFNDTAWKIFGYPDREAYVEAVRGNNKLKDVHPDDIASVSSCIAKVCAAGGDGRADCDHRIIRTDGSVRWLQALFQRVRGADGEDRVQVVFSDITEHKHESLLRVNSALFSVYDEIFELNTEQKTSFLRYSKYGESGGEGKVFTFDRYLAELCGRLANKEDGVKVRAFYSALGGGSGEPSALEYRVAGPGGETRWISSTLLRADGPTYLVCRRDITEIKNARRLAGENEMLQMLVNERRKEDERNRLFINSTGVHVYDYDPAADRMKIQRGDADAGVVEETCENYLATMMDNPTVSAADRPRLRAFFNEALAAPVRHAIEYAGDRFGNGFVTCRAQAASIADESGKIYRIIGQVSEVHEDNKGALSEKLIALTGFDYEKLSYHRPLVDGIMRTLDGAPDTGAAVRAVLAAAGRQFNVSRAYVFEEDGDCEHCSNTFEWCGEGVTPEKDNRQNCRYPDGMREKYLEYFNGGDIFSCPDTSELAGRARGIFAPRGVKALLQCAVIEAGVFHGFVGFDECGGTRNWTEAQKNTLRVISHIISSFILSSRGKYVMELPGNILRAMNDSPAYIYIIDPDTCCVLYCNDAVKAETGAAKAGDICYKAFSNRETLCEACPLLELGKTGMPMPTMTSRYGKHYIMQASPFAWHGRKAVIITGTDADCFAVDPNESRRSEYRRSLRRYADTLACVYDEILEFDFTDDLFTLLQTKFPRSISDGGASELRDTIDKWAERYVHKDDREALAKFTDIKYIRRTFSEGRAPTLTYRLTLPEGSLYYLQCTLLQLDAGRYLCCTKNVTEQKRAERLKDEMLMLQSQAEAQDRYRIVVEQTGTAVFEMNYKTGDFSCSEAYHKYAGSLYSYREMLSNTGDRQLVHEEDQKLLEKFFADTESGAPYAESVLRVRMTDGSFRWTKMAGTFIRDEGGQLLRTVGTFTDVDDEVRAKTALNEISSRMRQIIANVPAGVAIYEIREKNVYPIYTSDRTCEMFGFTRNECNLRIANSEPIGFMPNLKALPQGSVEKMLSGQPLVIRRERAHRKDGGEFWLRATYSMNKKEDGTTLCYAILADVSAEVENEQKYMLQAEMYKILSESADMITFDYAPQEDVMRIVMINPAGGSSEEVVERYMKKVLTNDHIQEDTRDSFLDTLKLASSAPTRGTFDFQWDYYGNGMRWYRAKYVSLADDEGAVYRVVGRLDDISDIKRAERGSLSERKNGSAGPAPEEGQR